jgi:thioredoxin reductase
MHDFDVVVIGGGAAGLSAALVLAKARRSVLVVDMGQPRNAPVAHMHGFLSRDGLPPSRLLTMGREEVAGYGAEFVDTEVTEIARCNGSWFLVRLADGRSAGARRILVATGLRGELPDVPGLRERWARDVLHCPYCHGYEVRDRELGVLGGSAEAVRYAQIVRQWSADLVYITPPDTLTDEQRAELTARGIVVVEGSVRRIVAERDRLTGVELTDGRQIRRAALFVPPRVVPQNDLLLRLGCDVDDAGWPIKDTAGSTTVPGVWVAGNVANPRAQVVTAAGEGSAAAIAINASLVDDDVSTAVHYAAAPHLPPRSHATSPTPQQTQGEAHGC